MLGTAAGAGGRGAMGLLVMRFVECDIAGKTAIISRFGHTGEYGYVYSVPADGAANLLETMPAGA